MSPQPTTFIEFWDLGYRRLVSIIPPDAPAADRLAKRIASSKKDPRGKAPGMRRPDGLWHGYDFTSYDPAEGDLDKWQSWGAGIGLKTGDLGDGRLLLFIDADTLDKSLAKIIAEAVDEHFGALPMRVGKYPKAGYVIACSGAFPYKRVEFGDNERCEILSNNRQFVAHGIHTDTRQPYHWPRALVPLHDLPTTTPEALDAFLADLKRRLPAAKDIVEEGGGAPVNQEHLKKPLEHVARAVRALPNTTELFPTREAYRDVGYAIKAALADHPDEAFALFDEWSDKWSDAEDGSRNEPGYAAAEWSRMKPPFKRGGSWLYELADRHAPQAFNIGEAYGLAPVRAEEEAANRAEIEQAQRARQEEVERRYQPTPFAFPDEGSIPPRRWLYGRVYQRGLLSLTVAPGGLGKSSLLISEALSMASGKPLLGRHCDDGPLRVWLWNGEDPTEELDRRITAAMKLHGVTPADVGDRLMIDSGFNVPIVLTKPTRSGVEIDEEAAQAITAMLIAHRIDVFTIDPYVSTHRAPENDNGAQDMVAKRWAKIAHDAKCAIGIVHHSRKTNGEEVTIEDSRGASSLGNTVRHGRALNRMGESEGTKKGVGADFWRFFKEGTIGKTNNSRPNEGAEKWFKMESVGLANGDELGVVTLWNGQGASMDTSIEAGRVEDILREISVGQWREDVQASSWVGKAVANVLGLSPDPAHDRDAIRGVLARLRKAKLIRSVSRPDGERKKRMFVEVADKFKLASQDNLSAYTPENNVFN